MPVITYEIRDQAKISHIQKRPKIVKIKISFQQFLRRRADADVQENEKNHPVN
ncbi:hypothetical protein LL3_03369 [Bacillus amyloliquefaciens LL3]|nr:hypothetical protein LL3_03369 [Bacillus amyloliquefaciens LL3]